MLKTLFCALVTLLLGLTACHKKTAPPTSPPAPPVVLVSVAPYTYFVQKIAGPGLEVRTLVPETSNPHVYEPKPQEIQGIAQAALWLRLGDPADQKVYRALKERNPAMLIVELTQGIALLSACKEGGLAQHCHEEGSDLHLWLSPKLAMQQAQAIAEGLSQAFPDNRMQYQEGLYTLLLELGALDREIAEELASKKGEAILVSHPAFAYFCRDYHLTQLTIETEGKEPLPRDVTEVLQQARCLKVTLVLLQPQYSNKGAQLIAEELDLPTAMVNPYAADYPDTMRRIAHLIAGS